MKRLLFEVVVTCFLIASPLLLLSQSAEVSELIKEGRYDEAVGILEITCGKAKPNYDDLINLAYCYIMNHNYDKAETVYQKIITHEQKKVYQNFLYAELLRANGKYEKAKEQYVLFMNEKPYDVVCSQRILSCDSLMKWSKIAIDKNIVVKNCSSVNSTNDEMYPWFYNGGILFSSNNDGFISKTGLGSNMQSPEIFNVYAVKDGTMTHIDMSSTNSTVSYMPRFGKELRVIKNIKFTTNGVELDASLVEIKEGDKWIRFLPKNFDTQFIISQPCLANKGNRIYFASNMQGGEGNVDIYYSDFVDGVWSEAVNLGKNINTVDNEMFPYVSDDGNYLYFSSDGLPGYGNLDIFVSTVNGNDFSSPVNLKKPYNSVGDDFSIVFEDYPKKGCFVSNRYPETMGGRDVFEFEINSAEELQKIDTAKPFVYNPEEKLMYVFFKTASAEILDEGKVVLDDVADLLKTYSYLSLSLKSFVDVRGSAYLNEQLLLERIKSVETYFISKGIDEKQLNAEIGGVSTSRELQGVSYHLQIACLNNDNSKDYFKEKIQNKYDVLCVKENTHYYYYIGNGSLEEMKILQKELYSSFKISSFIIATYKGQLLKDSWYSVNRRCEMILQNN